MRCSCWSNIGWHGISELLYYEKLQLKDLDFNVEIQQEIKRRKQIRAYKVNQNIQKRYFRYLKGYYMKRMKYCKMADF